MLSFTMTSLNDKIYAEDYALYNVYIPNQHFRSLKNF